MELEELPARTAVLCNFIDCPLFPPCPFKEKNKLFLDQCWTLCHTSCILSSLLSSPREQLKAEPKTVRSEGEVGRELKEEGTWRAVLGLTLQLQARPWKWSQKSAGVCVSSSAFHTQELDCKLSILVIAAIQSGGRHPSSLERILT